MHDPRRLPNYLKKLLKLHDQGKLPTAGLHDVAIYHDDWCAINQGKPCNCDPDIKVRPYPLVDPARN